MEQSIEYLDKRNISTIFIHSVESTWLSRLCGLECGLNGTNSSPRAVRGMFDLIFDGTSSSISEFNLVSTKTDEHSFAATWADPGGSIQWHTRWQHDPILRLWERRDSLFNSSNRPVTIRKALSRFVFSPLQLQFYVMGSTWAHESQGHWLDLPTGRLSLRSLAGRTNQGASPYLFLRQMDGATGIVFHLLPCGNWVIHIDRSFTAGDPQRPFTVIDMGISDDRVELMVGSGETLELLEILVQAVDSPAPEAAAPALHQYSLERFFYSKDTPVKPFAPIVYNTWFDTFETLGVDRLRRQLIAAQEIGCDVFAVDAGWYGQGAGPWDRQVGDWREKEASAFQGHMREFADEVRAAGLGFGLWMEPERFAAGVPVLKEHPKWFLPSPYGYFYPDLAQTAVYEYIFAEIRRLVETYQLAWMKIDFNQEMGHSSDALLGYYHYWYRLLDELRRQYPGTFFEGCASGGMRLDLNALSHFDGHFLSDTVDPLDVLRITQSTLLRVPPGRLTRWAVMKPLDGSIPGEGQNTVAASLHAGWADFRPMEVDFICRAALPGMFGLSGDLTRLSEPVKERLRWHVDFHKHWREFIAGSVCHLLTPIKTMDDRSGWVAFQLQNERHPGTSLLFVYRLDEERESERIALQSLFPEQSYSLTDFDQEERLTTRSGAELMEGPLVRLPRKFSAGIYRFDSIGPSSSHKEIT